MRCPIRSEKGAVESNKARPLSSSSAATRKFAPAAIAASRHSRWQPSPPTRRTTSASRTPNGTVAWSSESFRSSRRRSPRAHISRWKANCSSGSTRARTRTRGTGSGKIRVASIMKLDRAEKAAPESQEHEDAPRRSPPHKSLLFHSRKLSSPLGFHRWKVLAMSFELILPFLSRLNRCCWTKASAKSWAVQMPRGSASPMEDCARNPPFPTTPAGCARASKSSPTAWARSSMQTTRCWARVSRMGAALQRRFRQP